MKNNNIWLWGYVINKFPELVSSVPFPTWCSLETAARFLGCDNVLCMNSCFEPDKLDDEQVMSRLDGFKEIMLPLSHIPHGEKGDIWEIKYLETAEKIAKMSLKDPRITSVIIDDFRDPPGPTKDMKAEELAKIYNAIKKINPKLKLVLVTYNWQGGFLDDVVDYFDVVSYWNFAPDTQYWDFQWDHEIALLRQKYKKEIFQGIYLHDYSSTSCAPIPVDVYKVMLPRIFNALRDEKINGVMLLQNGWLTREDHREGITYIRNYIDYYLKTNTWLER